MLETLNELNKPLVIQSADSSSMKRYGRLIEGIDCEEMFSLSLKNVDLNGPAYIRDLEGLRQFESFKSIKSSVYGDSISAQAGLCFGMNNKMNGMEYHEGSEIIVAVTDVILILGRSEDIIDLSWNSDHAECYYLPRGTVLELYSNTLHLAPCRVSSEPFCTIIILPEGTNKPLKNEKLKETDPLYFMENKWLICHEESPAIARGGFKGISGKNIEIQTIS